uniref:Uncharacterized protein n=1 Tax=Daphnia galeata TaxID=27404 RepID=A0A8J2RYD2_9CRUS|nr:unnamed protein product [Daphnia galeata]
MQNRRNHISEQVFFETRCYGNWVERAWQQPLLNQVKIASILALKISKLGAIPLILKLTKEDI